MRPTRLLAATDTLDPRRILNGLGRGHPRLLLDQGRVEHLRCDPNDDEIMLLEALRSHAEVLMERPSPVINTTETPQAREFLDRIYTYGMLAHLDRDEWCARRAISECLALAQRQTWDTGHEWLICAELIHGMAIGIDWLSPWLSADEDRCLREALRSQGLDAADRAYATRAWWWRDPANWNIVCNSSVLIACLVLGHDYPQQARRCAGYALEGLPLALAGFANDGGWEEGPGYWGLGMRYLTVLVECCQSALGHDFALWELPGLLQVGTFRCHITGPSGLFAAFADSYQDAGFDPCLLAVARHTDPAVAEMARARIGDIAESQFFGAAARGLLWWHRSGSLATMPTAAVFPSCAVATARSDWSPEASWVVVKGGDVQAPHAHADCGSLVYESHGVRWFDDPGAGAYSDPGYWHGRPDTDLARWQHPACRTASHSTLLVNHNGQDVFGRAAIAAFHHDANGMRCTIDGDECYTSQGVQRWRRHVAFNQASGVLRVEDEVVASRPVAVRWQIVTTAGAEVIPGGVELSEGAHRCQLACPLHDTGTWRVEPLTDDNLRWVVYLDLEPAEHQHLAVVITSE